MGIIPTTHRGRLVLAACLAVLLIGCAGSPSRQSTGEYIDDSVITAKVKTALAQDDNTSATAVDVQTFKGNVQLSGFVGSEQARESAERDARSVEGVQSVENDLIVK